MSDLHLGRNIRAIRLLRNMKQEVFAQKLGVTQQNVSRLEARERVSGAKLQAAAQALGVTVEAIETFDETTMLRTTSDQSMPILTGSVKEIIAYFNEEIAKRDRLIDQLRTELNK